MHPVATVTDLRYLLQSQTTLCSNVESTAYAVIALGRSLALERSAEIANATHDTTQAIARGLDYVITNHKGSGGWGSTRDTLYAAWAVAETVRVSSISQLTLGFTERGCVVPRRCGQLIRCSAQR